MAAADIWNCPTLVVWQKQNQALDVAMADPDLTYEHPGTVRVWEKLLRTRYAALPCSEQEWLALSRGRDKSLAKVVAIFNEEGSPLLLGTDAPNPFVVHGCAIHQELENLVEAGLSPYEALRCGTVEAARFLGESNVSGTVAVGKRADLLLLRENPFADVGSMRKLDAVFVNGLYLTRADLDEMLEQHIGSLSERPRLELPGFEHTLNTGTARENTLEEWFSEIPVGLVTYRHVLLPSGGWQVDERSVRSGPRGREERTSRLWLASDWTLRRAEIESVTNVGCENNEIVWSDDGVFRVRVTQPDGYSTNSTVTSAPVLPSERLAVSVLPEWLALQSARTEASLLDIQHEAVQFAVLSAEPSLPNETGQSTEESVNWEVCITRPGETSSQMYRLSGDGKLLGLRDTLFGGPRELVSENLRGDRAAPP